jgi:phospholipid/cholesterol/gamma-HCH transport system substrate-binding protein
MQATRTVEIGVGFFVALGLAALVMLAMKVSNLSSLYGETGYTVTAKFQNIGGLKVKSPVKMGGVRIGRVVDIRYDDKLYKAVVTLKIDSQYTRIPSDTSASIFTAGLLGEQYLGLDAGGDDKYLTQNSELYLTQPAIVLEQLIGQFLYKSAAGDADKK